MFDSSFINFSFTKEGISVFGYSLNQYLQNKDDFANFVAKKKKIINNGDSNNRAIELIKEAVRDSSLDDGE